MPVSSKSTPLFTGAEWSYDTVERAYAAIEEVGIGELGLSCYPNQLEVITAEQMLDAYTSIGMPQMYSHWSFGKRFARHEQLYRRGLQGLAYELVINSDPCIVYLMETNTMTMQALVIAHAAFGHNHFYKNNELFRQWTDASSIRGYLDYARRYVAHCEEVYGVKAVERVLDAAHALLYQGVDHKKRVRPLNLKDEQKRHIERAKEAERTFNELWTTLPQKKGKIQEKEPVAAVRAIRLPEENLLYFLEKYAPRLKPWEREIIRIVRMVAQYFYPQTQTKVMNEGCASYVHYSILHRLFDAGKLTEGSMLEFLDSHSAVLMQPGYDDERYNGFNPYRLGFDIVCDIERIALKPTDEDREWFPNFAGRGDPLGVIKDAWRNYRDESFIRQFLSPALMRKWRMFQLLDRKGDPTYVVGDIHDERGYREIRRTLADAYERSSQIPDIQIVEVDFHGDRTMRLHHKVRDDRRLAKDVTYEVLQHLAALWGYPVKLHEVDEDGALVGESYEVGPSKG